ncbi:hypothetical protein GCM10009856_12100 [Mycolicibacterium llatzerense]
MSTAMAVCWYPANTTSDISMIGCATSSPTDADIRLPATGRASNTRGVGAVSRPAGPGEAAWRAGTPHHPNAVQGDEALDFCYWPNPSIKGVTMAYTLIPEEHVPCP